MTFLEIGVEENFIDCKHNKLESEGGTAFAHTLHTNNSLKSLDLSRNQINLEGIEELSDALATNSALNSLNIRLNTLKNIGEREIADALCKNVTLTSLDILSTQLYSGGKIALINALYTLTSLYMRSNSINSEEGEALAMALCENNTLTTLDLSQHDIYFEEEKR